MTKLEDVLTKDRWPLKKLQRKIQQSSNNEGLVTKLIKQYEELLINSQQAFFARKDHNLSFHYDAHLPLSAKAAELKELIRQHQVLIVAGETGSGKTTQLPKLCLELGLANGGLIGHTQPRRIAAESVSKRIAEELKVRFGEEVGFQVRFREKFNDNTLLKVMTDGILLAEIERDRYLSKYSTLIIDEAHERSLNIDFLLGYLKKILTVRKDLKVIITSATIDVEKFKNFFNAPLIEVSGRTYPVSEHYLDDDVVESELSERVCLGLDKVLEIEQGDKSILGGDVLVFLPGERDIREAMELIKTRAYPNTVAMPLYSRLNQEAQKKIFQPLSGKRRVILSTNVAETSLTVPNIRFVIDSGLARLSRYSPHQKIQRLPIEKISKASCNQRKGRAGRLMAGHCIRLFSQEEFECRSDFTEPEILRTNLAKVILKSLVLNIGSLQAFPLLDAPEGKYIRDGYKVLKELKAIDEDHKITAIGRQISKITLDPRLAKMVISANRYEAVFDVVVIASALSIQDPREFPNEKKEKARGFHQRFSEAGNDFISWLKLWDYLEETKKELSSSKFRKKCKEEFLNYLRINEWRDIVREVLECAKGLSLSVHLKRANNDAITQSLLPGLLSFIGLHDEKKSYHGANAISFQLVPGTSAYKKPPMWIVASSIVETSKLFARGVASLDPAWLLKAGSHLLTFQYSQAHWSDKRGEAFVYQKSSLYGLVVEEKKKVRFSPIDKAGARELFIMEALVNERYEKSVKTLPKFWLHNKKEKEKALELEARLRRTGVVKSDEELYSFFDKRLPEDVFDVRTLNQWLKDDKHEKILYFSESDLIESTAFLPDQALFPEVLSIESHTLDLKYCFSPGEKDDGVNVFVPVVILNQMSEAAFSWLVPGLLSEKISAVLKTLPKKVRKALHPIDSFANQLLLDGINTELSLNKFLQDRILKIKGLTVLEEEFSKEKLDDYYRMNVVVIDKDKKVLGMSRDLDSLKNKFLQETEKIIASTIKENKLVTFTEWAFSDLPLSNEKVERGITLKYYPALKDEGDSVSLVNFSEPDKAQSSHMQGLVRLASLYLRKDLTYVAKHLFREKELALLFGSLNLAGDEKTKLLDALVKETLFRESAPRCKAEFLATLAKHKSYLSNTANSFQTIICLTLKLRQEVISALKELTHKEELMLKEDGDKQLARLFETAFLWLPLSNLKHYPRYLKALLVRLEKSKVNLAKDRALLAEVYKFEEPFFKNFKTLNDLFLNEKALHFRFLLEEYRVSLFAQQLKTSESVSNKKLNKLYKHL